MYMESEFKKGQIIIYKTPGKEVKFCVAFC
jgi:hypothetical protein